MTNKTIRYEDEMESVEIYNVFRSRTLQNIFSELDYQCWSAEATIARQAEEIQELNRQIAKDLDDKLKQSYNSIGNTLSILLNGGKVTEPQSAVMLMKINDMQTIEEVKAYTQKLIENTKNNTI